jgi:spore coat protein CotF
MAMNNMILGEKEILNDLLNQEKQIIGTYSTAVTESTCPNMRQLLLRNINECAEDQFSVFNAMISKGYYMTKDAADQDVQQAKQKFQQMQSQL